MDTKFTVALICLLAPGFAVGVEVGVLDLYEKLTGKTLLIHNATLRLSESIGSELPPETSDAIARMESNFSTHGITIVHDGPHFVRIFPSDCRDDLKNVPLRGAEFQLLPSQKLSPAGTINFSMAALPQVLEIYGAYRRRTVLAPGNLPHIGIRMKNACPLTLEELVYAIETLLAFNGIVTVDDGPKFVQVALRTEQARIIKGSPKPEPTAKLLDPKRVPSLGNSFKEKPISPLEEQIMRWQVEIYNFFQVTKAPDRPAQRLLEFYGRLVAKKAEPSEKFDRMRIWFNIETPVSQSELLYAIETTFALNHLAIVSGEGNRIRLVASDGQGKSPSRLPDTSPPTIPQLPVAPKR